MTDDTVSSVVGGRLHVVPDVRGQPGDESGEIAEDRQHGGQRLPPT